jgi:hypothetical protein
VGPRASLDMCGKFCPWTIQPMVIRCTDRAIMSLLVCLCLHLTTYAMKDYFVSLCSCPVLVVIIFILGHTKLLVPMAARSKAFSQSSAEIAGLNPARGMDVCLL